MKLYAAKNDQAVLQIFTKDPDSGEAKGLFAQTKIRLNEDKTQPDSKMEFYVETVKDSSRYFVLRLENEQTKKHAFIGIGFRDRQHAFDFRAALEDHLRRVERMHVAAHEHEAADAGVAGTDGDGAAALPGQLAEKLRFKEGETVKLDLHMGGGAEKKSKKPKAPASESAAGESLLSLSAPPPPGSVVKHATPATEPNASGSGDGGDEDEWGDFQG